MCEPTTILLAVTAVVGAVGAMASAQSQEAMHEYNAEVAEGNARAEEAAGALEEYRIRDDVKRALAGMQAENAKSGFQLTGTPLLVAAESAKTGELDALTARFSRQLRASNMKAQAGLDRMSASAKKTEGYFGAASYLLGGATKAYGNYAG